MIQRAPLRTAAELRPYYGFCGALAVQQAMLETNDAEELIRSEQLQGVFRTMMAKLAGRDMSVYVSEVWVAGKSHKRVPGDPYVVVRSLDGMVSVTVSVKGGVRLMDYAKVPGLSAERVQKLVSALAKTAAQERLVATLKSAYRVTKDESLNSGMRSLELDL